MNERFTYLFNKRVTNSKITEAQKAAQNPFVHPPNKKKMKFNAFSSFSAFTLLLYQRILNFLLNNSISEMKKKHNESQLIANEHNA